MSPHAAATTDAPIANAADSQPAQLTNLSSRGVARAVAVSCAVGLGVALYVGSGSAAPALGAPQARVEEAYAAMGWAGRGFGEEREIREGR